MNKFKNFFGILENAFSIPDQMTVNGSIDAGTSGRIIGLVNGDVRTTGKLTINPEGIVRGNVFAGELLLYGKVYGNVVCTQKAILQNQSYIQGQVKALNIEAEEGAIIDGMIEKNGVLTDQQPSPILNSPPIEEQISPPIKAVTATVPILVEKDDAHPEHWF